MLVRTELPVAAPVIHASVSNRSRLLQRKCACGGTAGPTGECHACREQRRALGRIGLHPDEPSVVPRIVHDVLRSPGHALDGDNRTSMERRFGHDFSNVRVHSDARAAESAAAVNALAYTVGTKIVFNARQYSPRTQAGQELLAHELAHVVQQSNADSHNPVSVPAALTIERAGSTLEVDATRAARGIMTRSDRLAPQHGGQSRAVLQRQPVPRPTTESEQAADVRLRRLAARPSTALRAWKALRPAERSFVLMVMAGRYGLDFAQQFFEFATGKKHPDLSTSVTNTDAPQALIARGFRYGGDPGGTAMWVHPSGREVVLLAAGGKSPVGAGGGGSGGSASTAGRSDAEVARCEQVCADVDDSDECNRCCDERIPDTDNPCRINCKTSCATRL